VRHGGMQAGGLAAALAGVKQGVVPSAQGGRRLVKQRRDLAAPDGVDAFGGGAVAQASFLQRLQRRREVKDALGKKGRRGGGFVERWALHRVRKGGRRNYGR
jgi:hypothetical protein